MKDRKRYPLLTRLLMVIGTENDQKQALAVIDAARTSRMGLSYELVREAFKVRHQYKAIPRCNAEADGETLVTALPR